MVSDVFAKNKSTFTFSQQYVQYLRDNSKGSHQENNKIYENRVFKIDDNVQNQATVSDPIVPHSLTGNDFS